MVRRVREKRKPILSPTFFLPVVWNVLHNTSISNRGHLFFWFIGFFLVMVRILLLYYFLWCLMSRPVLIWETSRNKLKKAFCFQLFWHFTVWINCSMDFKVFANSWPSASNFKSFSRSLEQFFLTLGQNNFGNKIPLPFQRLFGDILCQLFYQLFFGFCHIHLFGLHVSLSRQRYSRGCWAGEYFSNCLFIGSTGD